MSAWAVGRGVRRTVRGTVLPALATRVVLERRAGRGWRRHGSARVSGRGAFAIPLRAAWQGRRTFRVRWLPPVGGAYRGAVSRSLVILGR